MASGGELSQKRSYGFASPNYAAAFHIKNATSFLIVMFGSIGTTSKGYGLVTVDTSAMKVSTVLVLPDQPSFVVPYLGTFVSSSQFFVPMNDNNFFLYAASSSINLPRNLGMILSNVESTSCQKMYLAPTLTDTV